MKLTVKTPTEVLEHPRAEYNRAEWHRMIRMYITNFMDCTFYESDATAYGSTRVFVTYMVDAGYYTMSELQYSTALCTSGLVEYDIDSNGVVTRVTPSGKAIALNPATRSIMAACSTSSKVFSKLSL